MDQSELKEDPLDELLRSIDEAFEGESTPGAFYDADGDCAFIHAEPVAYYRERVDNLLTVFRRLEGPNKDAIVGLQVKNIKRFGILQVDARVERKGDASESPVHTVELLLSSHRHSFESEVREHRANWNFLTAYAEAFKTLGDSDLAQSPVRGLTTAC